ncbi:MAG: glycosyltransferase [Sulfobacillus sp.]
MDEWMNMPLRTEYLYHLTDDTGIFQHTKFGVPDRSHGYTTDDNARALIAAVMLYKTQRDAGSLNLMNTYLSFVHHAQNHDGYFRNFMGYSRSFLEERGSEDCLGRCLWAIGYTLSEQAVPDNMQNTCRYMLNEALPNLRNLTAPRAMAYALVGLCYVLDTPGATSYAFPYPHAKNEDAAEFLPREAIVDVVEELSSRLRAQYAAKKGPGWHWFEDIITYGNAMLPWALFKASHMCAASADLQNAAQESLDFLLSVTFSPHGYFRPIGSHGWLVRDGQAARYDEQPIEACETMLACQEAYAALGDPSYLTFAAQCFAWFHGRNSMNQSLIDPQTGACYDGIHSEGLNLNQGSENIVSYCIAHLARTVKNHDETGMEGEKLQRIASGVQSGPAQGDETAVRGGRRPGRL